MDEKLKKRLSASLETVRNDIDVDIYWRKLLITRWYSVLRSRYTNKPVHYYHYLKALVGYEQWKQLPSEMQEAWEEAACSLERQHALVEAWCKALEENQSTPEERFGLAVQEAMDYVFDKIPEREKQNKASEKVMKMLTALGKKLADDDFNAAVDELNLTLNSRDEEETP